MARKKKADAGGASSEESYLVAFGSTMTILLALFITLSVLANDQEGGFKAGTGAFVRALDTFGFPGLFAGRESVVEYDALGPRYQAGTEEGEGKKGDATEESGMVNDLEQERVAKLLRQLRQSFESQSEAGREIRVAVVWIGGFVQPVRAGRPVLNRQQLQQLVPYLTPLFSREVSRVYVEVFTPEPRAERLREGLEIAEAIAERLMAMAGLARTEKLIPVVRPGQGRGFRARLVLVR